MSRTTIRPVTPLLFTALVALSYGIAACSSDGNADRTFEEQVEEGGALFGDHCAECHGESGQGTDNAPRLVGEGALPEEPPEERMFRTNDFNTAADVYAFANEYMPADDPDSVSDTQMVDILAFALSANGIELDEQLTLDNADEVVIHE
jgi:S-disulfanyl-L-cysteine oxidoreductase SoxD